VAKPQAERLTADASTLGLEQKALGAFGAGLKEF